MKVSRTASDIFRALAILVLIAQFIAIDSRGRVNTLPVLRRDNDRLVSYCSDYKSETLVRRFCPGR
jgi:hypothetical protein